MPIRPEMKARNPVDWKLRSHFVRFVRAKGDCEWCGVPHGWDVWRHRDNHKCWWARKEIAPAGYYVRTTASRMLMDPPIGAVGPVRIVLTTAHVHDMRPEAASLLNLAALCQLCHNRHDAEHRRQGRRERAHAQQPDLFARVN